MKKRQNTIDSSVMLTGLSYGEHVMRADKVVEDLTETLKNCGNSFIVRCQPDRPMDAEMYSLIAKYAKDNSMPFAFLYAYQHPPKGKNSHLTAEIVKNVKEIAGDLFLGEMFGEIGSQLVAKDYGYFGSQQKFERCHSLPSCEDMSDARRKLVGIIKEMTDYNKSLGLDRSMVVEATSLFAYDMEGGITIPVLEVLPGDPEKLIPFTRGAAISYKRPMWGCFVAHEWYGGYRHFDELKKKRLELTYKHLFMQGSNIAFLESGNTEILSYDVSLGYDSDICRGYRRVIEDFHDFTKKNPRPKCGPYTTVAFVFGEDDAYTDFMGGVVYEQFGKDEWGKHDAERSWRILSEVYRSRDWHDPLAFASDDGLDLNHAPAYGCYDVISASAPLDVMSNYSYLIFVGHNTMNEELYDKLVGYVKGGGVLLMSAAHLSTNPKRLGENVYVKDGDISELFGCRITGSVKRIHGTKFEPDSAVPGLKYPGTPNKVCDPIFTEGLASYATVEITTATQKAELYAAFNAKGTGIPVILENKIGNGCAIFMTHESYPGNPAVYPIYRNVVKGLLAASHANADVKVIGSDKVRFSLFYDEDGHEVLYLLNTAYDVDSSVKVIRNGNTTDVRLAPMELRSLELKY